jgi:hypothetical protein
MLLRAILVLCLVAVGIALYWSGVSAGRADAQAAAAAHSVLELELRSRVEELRGLEQQVRNLSTNIEIERAASSQVRSELATAQSQIEHLQQEAELYRSLMDSNARSRGLSLQTPEIRRLQAPGAYHYRLTLLQRAERHVELVGQVRVSVIGLQSGNPLTLGLEQVAVPRVEAPIPVRFTYFQFIEGELRLPEDFAPSQIRVVVKIGKGRPQTIDVTRPWPEGEG